MDFILNGQATGGIAAKLLDADFQTGMLRPWKGRDGKSYMSIMQNGELKPVQIHNAPATLRKDEWQLLDEAIVRVARPRLRVVGDLRAAGLQFTIPQGMGKTVLQTETESNIDAATVSMDGLRKGEADRPHYSITNLPLPIIHKDFNYSARQIAASRNMGMPLDTSTAELAARRVAEEAEKLALGTAASFAYGGGTIYGFTNFPDRLTKTLTDPTASGWTPATLVGEVLEMKTALTDNNHFGPYMIYHGTFWDEYMDDDYVAAAPQNTLRERLRKIDGIDDVKTADFLTGNDLIVVQMTSDVVREVVGMDITTVQWETDGGMNQNFKVMAILVPQIRSDFDGQAGINHGSF